MSDPQQGWWYLVTAKCTGRRPGVTAG